MFARLLARWRTPPGPPPTTSPVPSVTADETVAKMAIPRPPAPETATVVAPPVSAWHLLARRPAIDASGAIAGWELRLSDWAVQRLVRAGVQASMQQTYGFALAQAARAASSDGRRPLVSLVGIGDRNAVIAQLPAGTILLVGDGSGNPASILAGQVSELHRAGIQVAAPPEPRSNSMADFALLDASRLGSAEVLRRCRQPAPVRGGWIAINLASFDEVAEAVRRRATLAYGHLVQPRSRSHGALAPPAAALQVGAILGALVGGRPPRDIAEMFKSDVTLSFRLLRYLSIAGVGQGRRPQTIQEAVTLLGSNELHRWLCMLLADSGASPIATALHETALTRGRLLELLAIERREPQSDALFVLGAFSLLDVLLDVPLEAALALAPIAEPAIDALIAESGPWRPYLEAALALEAGDVARLDEASASLGLARDDVVALNEKAARWSTEAALLLRQSGREHAPALAET